MKELNTIATGSPSLYDPSCPMPCKQGEEMERWERVVQVMKDHPKLLLEIIPKSSQVYEDDLKCGISRAVDKTIQAKSYSSPLIKNRHHSASKRGDEPEVQYGNEKYEGTKSAQKRQRKVNNKYSKMKFNFLQKHGFGQPKDTIKISKEGGQTVIAG